VLDGDLVVMHMEEDAEIPGRKFLKRTKPKAFEDHFGNRRIERDTANLSRGASPTQPLGKAWLEWPGRASANGFTFDTSADKPILSIRDRIINDRLNLWTGFGVVPDAGEWSRFRAMILDDLCSGDAVLCDYVLKWIAWKIQNPAKPCETSLVFKGAKGTGKTTLGEAMVQIFGSHGLPVSRRSQFAGQFSGHLINACFVFADEAVWGGNKEEGTLKKLITDKHTMHRAMYKEEALGVNRIALMMATNEQWAVPATFEERRFVVSEVSDANQIEKPGITPEEKARRVAYWAAVHSELKNGGLESFMHAMQTMDLGDWTPRRDIPKTAALAGQVEQGLRGVQRWIYEFVTARKLPAGPGDDVPEMWVHPIDLPSTSVLEECRQWMASRGRHEVVSHRGLLTELRKFGWTQGQRTRSIKRWKVPAYKDAVAALEERLGKKVL
jgi:Family of unknown function (DUF5906)